jgi:hypothetical protein
MIPNEKNHREDEFIGAEGTEAIGEGRRSGEARTRDVEEQLDAALACTFPCSDPISCQGDVGCPR